MPLPELRYYSLTDIAARGSTSVDRIVQFALDDLVELAVLVVNVRVSVGYLEEGVSGMYPVEETEELLIGPQALRLEDLWRVSRRGVATISAFKARYEGGFVEIVAGVGPIEVLLSDLRMTRSERDRFEVEHSLRIDHAGSSERPPATPRFVHSPDFRHIEFAGRTFRFGERQAAIVRLLYEAAESGRPWVSIPDLLEAAGSESSRLVDLFKTQPGWRDLIQSARGRARLAPASPAKAYRRSNRELNAALSPTAA